MSKLGARMVFSLLSNSFAVLAADPVMSADALADLAAREGTPQAAAALHTLTAPRTRLTAELAFLPGAAARASEVVQRLRHGERPELDSLPDQARVNVLAHLCDAHLAEEVDPEALVAGQVERGSPALVDLVAADRRAAGFPAPDLGFIAAAQDELAEAHAAALVRACLHGQGAAGRLATLMRRDDWPRPAAARALLRRASAVWARETAGQAATADEAVGRAETALSRAPGEATAEAFISELRAWAELTAPERLADAAAGLDHEASAAKARRWRGLTQRLASGDAAAMEAGASVAEALMQALGDLPGFAVLLRRDRDTYTAVVRDRAQAAAFSPLQELIQRFTAEPGPLIQALFGYAGFGPKSLAQAEELWTAFVSVRAVAPESRRPFDLLSELAVRLGAHGSPPAELLLIQGLITAAQAGPEASDLPEVLRDLRAHERVLLRRAGLAKLQSLTAHWRAAGRAVREIDRLLPLADDPALRAQLSATRQRMQRRVASMASSLAVGCAVLVLAAIGIGRETMGGSGGAATATAVSGYRPPPSSDQPAATLSAPAGTPLPATEPQAGALPADAAAAPVVMPDAAPRSLAVPATPPKIHFDPTTPPESKPNAVTQVISSRTGVFQRDHLVMLGPAGVEVVYSLPQVRWCLFNEVRLKTVRDALADQDDARKKTFTEVAEPWNELCTGYRDKPGVAARVEREARDYHGALVLQAQQIQHQIEDAAP